MMPSTPGSIGVYELVADAWRELAGREHATLRAARMVPQCARQVVVFSPTGCEPMIIAADPDVRAAWFNPPHPGSAPRRAQVRKNARQRARRAAGNVPR